MRASAGSGSADAAPAPPAPEWLLGHAVVAFDVDDTLVATFARAYRKTVLTATTLGCEPPPHEAFADGYERADQAACFRQWFPHVGLAEAQRAYDALQPRFPDEPLVDFGALRRLLSAHGLLVGVLTNSPARKLRRKLACLGGAEGLDFALAREQLPRPKPSPEAFAPLIAEFARTPSEVVYVADSHADWVAATAAGVSFLHVRSGPRAWRPPAGVPSVPDAGALGGLLSPTPGA